MSVAKINIIRIRKLFEENRNTSEKETIDNIHHNKQILVWPILVIKAMDVPALVKILKIIEKKTQYLQKIIIIDVLY